MAISNWPDPLYRKVRKGRKGKEFFFAARFLVTIAIPRSASGFQKRAKTFSN